MSSPTPAPPVSARRLFQDMAQGSGIYLLGFILQRLASLLMIPITTRFLSPADYGVADLLEQSTSVISMLLGGRLASALGYFYFQADSEEARRPVVSTAILGALALGLLAAMVCWPFSGRLSELVFGDASAGPYFRIVFVYFPPGFAADAIFTLYRVENRPGLYTVTSLLRLALQMGGIVLLVALFRLRVAGMMWAAVISIIPMAVGMGIGVFRRMAPAFDLGVFGRMVRYSTPLALGGIAAAFMNFGDRFILPHYRSLGELGIYVLAYKFGLLMTFIYGSFQIYWSAQVFQIMRRDDAEPVFARMFTYVILGMSFSGVAIAVCAHPALRLMAAPAFQGAAALVPVIVAAYCVKGIGDFLRCLFLAEGRPGYDAVCNWLGAVGCLGAYVLLIPKFGAWGAAYATLAAFIAVGIVSAVWTYRLRPYRVETGRLAKICVASAAAASPYAAIHPSSLPGLIGMAALSLALFPLVLWILRFPTATELQLGWKALHSLAQLSARGKRGAKFSA
jgi:O-antigen/teichoic acid export membrane protein